eukprot:COSAG02_NODE_1440_length_12590_cov_2.822352_6_plen_705_part_00
MFSWCGSGLASAALILAGLAPYHAAGLNVASSPFYRDPLFDGAHDPELVWNHAEQCYWLLYLQNRYNIPLSDPAPLGRTSLTDIGLASTPDGGRSWVYRGVAEGLDVPASARADELPPSGTQQYGGATWWRPAVTFAGGVYHAFWIMWESSRGMKGPDGPGAYANWNLIHYTSNNLKSWRYNQTVRTNSFAYDSDVFRLADGRYILFSTGQTRLVRGNPKVLQSYDLYHWSQCTDPGLQVNIDEGPHATWNDMSIKWRGFAFINWDGSAHFGTNRPNMMRTSDGGLTWEMSNTTLYPGAGTRHLDLGAAHQGPLLLNQGAGGEGGWALYFSEFSVGAEYAQSTGCGTERAVLQLAAVETDSSGWPVVNRSNGPPNDLTLTPPPHASLSSLGLALSTSPWSIGLPEAMVIACAEINRWHPGWFAVMDIPSASSPATKLGRAQDDEAPPPGKQGHNCSLAGPFYRSAHLPMDGCITVCEADPQCQGFTWKHVETPAGSGVAVTVNCTGKAGQPCCYFQTKAAIKARMSTPLFDCWAKHQLPRPQPPPPPAPASLPWAGPHSCCCTSCTLPAECHGAGGAGVTAACPSMMWRDPKVAAQFFSNSTSSGRKAALVWHLNFAATDKTKLRPIGTFGRRLNRSALTSCGLCCCAVAANLLSPHVSCGCMVAAGYQVDVLANGTIKSLWNTSAAAAVTPLRQFRYDGLADV